jgi:hypothetical protein
MVFVISLGFLWMEFFCISDWTFPHPNSYVLSLTAPFCSAADQPWFTLPCSSLLQCGVLLHWNHSAVDSIIWTWSHFIKQCIIFLSYNPRPCDSLGSHFSPLGPVLVPRSFHEELSVDKVALGQTFFWVLWFSPVSIILPLLHIHSCFIWGMDNALTSSPVW